MNKLNVLWDLSNKKIKIDTPKINRIMDEKPDKAKQIQEEHKQRLNSLYNHLRNKNETIKYSEYVGGAISLNQVKPESRDALQQQIRKNLKNLSDNYNLRLGVNPMYLQESEALDTTVFDKIKSIFIKLTTGLRNNNFNKDVANQANEILSIMLNSGYNLTSSNISQILQYLSSLSDILTNEIVQNVQDIKDNSVLNILMDVLSNIEELAKKLQTGSDLSLRERKQRQEGIKTNFETELLSSQATQKRITEVINNLQENKLKYDDNYLDLMKKKAENAEKRMKNVKNGWNKLRQGIYNNLLLFKKNEEIKKLEGWNMAVSTFTDLTEEFDKNNERILATADDTRKLLSEMINTIKIDKQTIIDDRDDFVKTDKEKLDRQLKGLKKKTDENKLEQERLTKLHDERVKQSEQKAQESIAKIEQELVEKREEALEKLRDLDKLIIDTETKYETDVDALAKRFGIEKDYLKNIYSGVVSLTDDIDKAKEELESMKISSDPISDTETDYSTARLLPPSTIARRDMKPRRLFDEEREEIKEDPRFIIEKDSKDDDKPAPKPAQVAVLKEIARPKKPTTSNFYEINNQYYVYSDLHKAILNAPNSSELKNIVKTKLNEKSYSKIRATPKVAKAMYEALAGK
jgi:hypothetical protein